MSWSPQVRAWNGKKAILFVHGVGDSVPGGYDDLVATFLKTIGDADGDEYATYFLYYDDVNDWFDRKIQFTNVLARLEAELRKRFRRATDSADLATAAAEVGGDVLFPVFLRSVREAVLLRYLTQVSQMRLDARTSGVSYFDMEISIVCHSLGCFHTFEALHRMANDPSKRLMPATDGASFQNVVFMASPVKLIRTVAEKLGGIVPGSLATQAGDRLRLPGELGSDNIHTSSSRNWVAIAGDQDPVGGHLFRKKLGWAHMNIPEMDHTIIQRQALTKSGLTKALKTAADAGASPALALNNPHSWSSYITTHQPELRQWFA